MKKNLKIIMYTAGFLYLYKYTKLKISKYEIKNPKIKENLRVVLLADLHSVCYGKNQQMLEALIDKQEPDIIAMAGDMVDDRFDNIRSYQIISKLTEKYPCYFVTGNHEFKTKHGQEIKETLKSIGVHVLEGYGEKLPGNIAIYGVDDPHGGKRKFKEQYSRSIKTAKANVYNIFLQHKPAYVDLFGNSNLDLMLSGHTHGGQIILPGFNLAFYASGQGFLPKYFSGIHDIKDKKLIISRGLTRNTRGVPRVFNPQELVVIDLIPETAKS